jgi:hypothetical protein
MHGKGKRAFADGEVAIARLEANEQVGQGAIWSADRAQAWELLDFKGGKQAAVT